MLQMDLIVTGELTVVGKTTLRSTLTTPNFTRFQAVAAQGNLVVSGPAVCSAKLAAVNCEVDGTINVTGILDTRAFQSNSGLQIDGPMIVKGQGDIDADVNITTGGSTTISGPVIVFGNLNAGTTNLNGGVTVSALVSVGQTLTATSSLVANNLTSSSGNVNNFTTSSNAAAGSDLIIVSNLDAGGKYECGGDLTVLSNIFALKDGLANSFVSIGGSVECKNVGVTGHIRIKQPSVPPTISASVFFNFDGIQVSTSASVAPDSSDFAGEIVITPGNADNFGTPSSQKVSTIDVKFGNRSNPTFQASIILLQNVTGFVYPADDFWTVSDLTTQGEITGFRLSVNFNLFQGFPGNLPLRVFWFCTQLARFVPP